MCAASYQAQLDLLTGSSIVSCTRTRAILDIIIIIYYFSLNSGTKHEVTTRTVFLIDRDQAPHQVPIKKCTKAVGGVANRTLFSRNRISFPFVGIICRNHLRPAAFFFQRHKNDLSQANLTSLLSNLRLHLPLLLQFKTQRMCRLELGIYM